MLQSPLAGTGPHLCFINSLRGWGGAEVWFLDTARELQDRGHRVSVIAQPDSELLIRCQAAGVPVQPVAIRFDAAIWTLAKLWRYFRSTHVSALVTNLTKDLKAASVAGRLAGVPVILASRESDFPLKNKIYYRWYFNHLTSGLLVNSRATAQTVLDSAPWLDPRRVHLLYKGIDLARFTPGETPGEAVIGFAGQLIERKGLGTLMEAWSAREQNLQQPPALLRLAGSGPLRPNMERWRKGLQHPEQVQLLGPVENMADFYRGLTLLVLPSWSEGFGLVAAEAMACGVPVIASRASSLPEIVTDRQTGLLVPPGRPAELRAAMDFLLQHRPAARKMGLAGREAVQEKFPLEQTLDRLVELTGLDRAPTRKTRS